MAATKLYSGDIKIHFAGQKEKDKATQLNLNTQQQLHSKFLREEFPVEVLAVNTDLPVTLGKAANNEEIIKEITEDNKTWNPDIEITRIAWIKGHKSIEERGGMKPKHASLIIYMAKESAQRSAVLQGITIQKVIHTAQLYDPMLQNPLCYKCNRWGHTQSTCHGAVTCGYCAENHQTNECPKQAEKGQKKCRNCNKEGHTVWERTV